MGQCQKKYNGALKNANRESCGNALQSMAMSVANIRKLIGETLPLFTLEQVLASNSESMGEPTTTVLEMLIATLSELQKSPELTEADAQWLQL